MMMQMPKLPKSVQALGAMAVMTFANTLPVSAKALESKTSKIAQTATEEVAYKAACYAQGKDLFVKVEEYNLKNIDLQQAGKQCAGRLSEIGDNGVNGGFLGVVEVKGKEKTLPDRANKKTLNNLYGLIQRPDDKPNFELLPITGAVATTAAVMPANTNTNTDISLLTPPKFVPPTITAKHNSKHHGRNLVQKPPQTSVKHNTTQKPKIKGQAYPARLVDLNDKTTTEFTTVLNKQGAFRVPTDPNQVFAVCAVPSNFVKHRFAMESAITIPKGLAGASTKAILKLNNEAITKFYNDCINKSNSVFGTTMKSDHAIPRVLPGTFEELKKFDLHNNLNLNTSVENGEKREF
jgi:hypothetical protein